MSERLAADLVHVPAYPAVLAKLQQLMARGSFGMRELASVVSSDPTLSATALRHANSAAHGGTGRVETLEGATFRLGVDELCRLALATSVSRSASAPGPLAALRREQWQASLINAMVCQALAPQRKIRTDVAFTAGLLHDFGAIVALASVEEVGLEKELPALPADTWRHLVEGLHVDFGVLLARRWNLPTTIVDVIASHHYPEAALRINRPLVELVLLADQLTAMLLASPAEGVEAFAQVVELGADERRRLGALLPRIADAIAAFETASRGQGAEVPSKIVPEPDAPAGSWPVDFAVLAGPNEISYRACHLAPGAVVVRGAAPLPANALARARIEHGVTAIELMVNVRSCVERQPGEHVLSLAPFALDGEPKVAWHQLLVDTRRAVGLPREPPRIATYDR